MIYLILFFLLLPVLLYFQVLIVETKSQWGMRLYLKLAYKIKIEGLENIPKTGPCILVCNHFSYIDWMFIMCTIPRPVHFIIHYRFYYTRFAHSILKRVGAIPISGDGEKPKMISEAFAKVGEEISKGKLVLIFPEGGITRDGKVNRFKKGVVKIKEACPGAPVIPVALDGLWGGFFSYSKPGLFSFKKIKFKKVPITIKISPEYKKNIDANELQKEIKQNLKLKDDKYYIDHQSYL